MKKVFLLFAFIILFANTAFANIYYISELNKEIIIYHIMLSKKQPK